jgi:type 1 glutamine amidotransferase
MTTRIPCVFLLGVLYALASVCYAAPARPPIRVLIVDGFSNHDWAHGTRCIKAILAASATCNVAVSTFPASGTPDEQNAWDPNFAAYDVVIQTCNDLGNGLRWPPQVERALETYVHDGGGLFIFHAGNNAFRHWQEYNRMIGLGWRKRDFGCAISVAPDGSVVRIPAGEGGNTGHGKRANVLLTRWGDHPIHKGLPRQWKTADLEIYRYARGPAENLTVLSYAPEPATQLNFPIEWVVDYGKGRVYNSTFGHVWKGQKEPEGMRCAGWQTIMVRAVQWLAKVEIDSQVPSDFPGTESAVLRP